MFEALLERLGWNAQIGKSLAESRTGVSFDDDRGQAGMANRAVQIVVALTVGGIVAAFLLPVAIDELVAVDTSSWSSGASSMWAILDVIIVLVVFLFFISLAVAKTR